ncbi:hypothetical protein HA402_008565 [Bradysia odoriphaga]|nr:hypothetical protein HA402_008565 [Bradysia odoriphaga]
MNFINIFVQLFSLLLKKDSLDYHKINGYAIIISQWLSLGRNIPKIHPDSYQKITTSPLWTTISRTCLKAGITAETSSESSGILLKIFGFLCDHFYANDSENAEPAQLYEMALSHSAFFDLALQTQRSHT